ncbi:pyrroloquinoline quinone biosynthesis protein PqqE [Thermogemmatispora sp.]|uniref:pyrroloquinoline quinone biosynthesis protein PqqE n=1 Tax=Thermogemmatispora sp. TaxID=1968838 RepID=UPI002ACC37CC|nr:pyrroloquinoline quinone biosynthesis protein PqqE [Thermogemmatispora sp.]
MYLEEQEMNLLPAADREEQDTSEGIPSSKLRPFGLLAELTYRCPLHCPYCSNPVQLSQEQLESELTTAEWQRVIREAASLGVLHLLFSGGEPLLRRDLSILVATARSAGLYTNLLTSAIGLTRRRLRELQEAGLDSVQISFQADEAALANGIAGCPGAHERKLEAARLVQACGLPLTINLVLHRGNIERLPALIALAEQLGAQRLELANTQYLGWAFSNRAVLLPTRAQVHQAEITVRAAQERLRGRMEIVYILPDYHAERPKPCMYGWGRRYLSITPDGAVLPCQNARIIPDLHFDNIRQRSLASIWKQSEAFERFRGSQWMPEPCRSCPLREHDFGGCRCQAFLLTGNAANTDPACSLSPHRHRLLSILAEVERQQSATSSGPGSPFAPNGQPLLPIRFRRLPQIQTGE